MTDDILTRAEQELDLYDSVCFQTTIDLMAEVKRSREALKEAGDVIEAYHKTTGIDLGDASRMPFYADTMKKIDAALKGDKT